MLRVVASFHAVPRVAAAISLGDTALLAKLFIESLGQLTE
jgi:hypothetical protein